MSVVLPRCLACPHSRLVLALISIAFACGWTLHRDNNMSEFLRMDLASNQASNGDFSSRFASHAPERFVHAASITQLPDSNLFAVWFGGSREGAEDVQIYGSHFNQQSGLWTPEHVVIDRARTEAALGKRIRKLGNPVVGTAPDGKVWLFYVSVSLGGWATSTLNFMTSTDLGQSWSEPRRLVTTPFFNISTLVRGRPVFHADGTIGLPVYHEAIGKFPEYLRLDADGNVLDKVRLDYGRDTLQPYPVVFDGDEAVALLRDGSEELNRMYVSHTVDAGSEWSTPQATSMPNPNSAIAAVNYGDNEILVALNDLEADRYRLSLYLTDREFRGWLLLKTLEEPIAGDGKPLPFEQFKQVLAEDFQRNVGPRQEALISTYLAGWSARDARGCKAAGCEFHYDYPYLIKTSNNQFELIYSWNKSMIKHVSISRKWLEQQRMEKQRS